MAEVGVQSPKVILKYQGTVVKECVITKPEFTIGRKPDNDLVVEHSAVSGHHARIVKVQAVYFIEDLQSTNGTFVNGHKTDRKQLCDADVIAIGKHRIVYMEEEVAGRPAALPPRAGMSEETVMQNSGVHSSPSNAKRKVGMIKVVAGRTDHSEYELTRQLTIIGAERDAFIKLTGFFAPKSVAMIGRRGDTYYIAVPERMGKVRVNDLLVETQVDLQDGDLLEVAGVKMFFHLKDAA